MTKQPTLLPKLVGAILLAVQSCCNAVIAQTDFWEQTSLNVGTISSLTIKEDGTIIAGFDDGTVWSKDNGMSWTLSGPSFFVVSVCSHPSGSVFAADSYEGIFRTTDDGLTWTGPDVEVGANVVISDATGMLFSGTPAGFYRSTDAGVTWDSLGGSDCPPIFSGTSPVQSIVTYSNNLLLAGNSYAQVLLSIDNGESWEIVGIPIPTQNQPMGDCSGFEVAVHADLSNTIYAGVVWQSVYRADSTFRWSETHLPSGEAVKAIVSNSLGHVFAGTRDGVFRSTDRGDTWVQINEGLSALAVRSLLVRGDGYIFAGTEEGGLFRSIEPTTSVPDAHGEMPSPFGLFQSYPNPFNPNTTIRFSIPRSGEISLRIFNLLGEEVATLVSGLKDAGTHTVQWDATGQPSGVYFYRLRAVEYVETRKLVLLR